MVVEESSTMLLLCGKQSWACHAMLGLPRLIRCCNKGRLPHGGHAEGRYTRAAVFRRYAYRQKF